MEAPESNLNTMTELSSGKLFEQIKQLIGQNGFTVIGEGQCSARYASREEVLELTPRKKHRSTPEGQTICGSQASRSNIVNDPKEVTCKLCIKKMLKGRA